MLCDCVIFYILDTNNECPDQNNVMSASLSISQDDLQFNRNNYIFSTCSIEQFETYIADLNS